MGTLVLNNNDLLSMARSKEVSTEYWAKIMIDTKKSRGFFTERFREFQNYRYWTEMAVKGAVVITLGVGLFWASPAALLYGAALTLAISSLAYWQIKLNKYEIEIPESSDVQVVDFNSKAWEQFRGEWSIEAQNQQFSDKQKDIQHNMTRLGMALVIGFACFVGISSGVAIPIAISTVLFSGSLFDRFSDDPVPYPEEKELPALTLSK